MRALEIPWPAGELEQRCRRAPTAYAARRYQARRVLGQTVDPPVVDPPVDVVAEPPSMTESWIAAGQDQMANPPYNGGGGTVPGPQERTVEP